MSRIAESGKRCLISFQPRSFAFRARLRLRIQDPSAPPLGSVPISAPNDVFDFPSASEHSAELQFLFNFGEPLQALVPGLQPAHPFFTFRRERFCRTWPPIVVAEVELRWEFQSFRSATHPR